MKRVKLNDVRRKTIIRQNKLVGAQADLSWELRFVINPMYSLHGHYLWCGHFQQRRRRPIMCSC